MGAEHSICSVLLPSDFVSFADIGWTYYLLGLWLKKWPSDWQNASVPFFAVMVLLSLFWLPLVHNGNTMDRRRMQKDKSI